MESEMKTYLAYTNPLIMPVGIGMFLAAFTKSVFGGPYHNMKKILN